MPPETATSDPPIQGNFGRLVLGCMGSYDSESRVIFHIFRDLQESQSFASLQNQLVAQIFVKLFAFFIKFLFFLRIFDQFQMFRTDFDENLSEFHGIEKCFTKFPRNLES